MNLKKKIITSLATAITLISATIINASAAVDVSGGLEHVFNELKVELKDVAALGFALAAVVCLIVAFVKLIGGFIEHHRGTNSDFPWKPVGFAFAAALVCSLAASANFFGWFGV